MIAEFWKPFYLEDAGDIEILFLAVVSTLFINFWYLKQNLGSYCGEFARALSYIILAKDTIKKC